MPQDPPESQSPDFTLDGEVPWGCFAWSEQERTAACTVGSTSLERGGAFYVDFVGERPQRFTVIDIAPRSYGPRPFELDGPTKELVERRLREGGYQAIEAASQTAEVGQRLAVGDGRAVVLLRQRVLRHVAVRTGEWDTVEVSAELRCAEKKATPLRRVMPNPQAELAVYPSESGTHLLIALSATWAIEGDSGGFQSAVVMDLDTCRSVEGSR